MIKILIPLLALLSVFQGCTRLPPSISGPETLNEFVEIVADSSGLHFSNHIEESQAFNYFTFPYLYMGGGVAIGDLDNDGLSDIFLTGNMSPNKLYRNNGHLSFQDITMTAKMAGDHKWYTGVTMTDINQDGYLDIYASVSGMDGDRTNELYINNQDLTFTERAEAYGLNDSSPSIQATFFDYNNDGYLDVYVANYPVVPVSQGNKYYYQKMIENKYADSGHLYRNNGDQTFTDVTTTSGVHRFGLTLGVVSADLNQDGWQDLYISNDFNVPDYLYLNNRDGTFSEVSQEVTGNTSMFGMGVDIADFNNDGLMDILQMDMTPEDHLRSKTNMASMNPESFQEAVDLGFHYQYMQNSLQLNQGVLSGLPRFHNISRLAGVATTDWSWGGLFLDIDNDGWKDIIVTNGMKRDVNNNDANTQLEKESFFGAQATNYNILPSTPISNYAFLNNGGLTFSNRSEALGLDYRGFSNGISYGDLDNDGDLDLVINNIDDKVSLLENTADLMDNHHIQVALKGSASNRFGVDARVTVYTSGHTQIQHLTLSRGFQSSVAPTLHYGLGQATTIDKITVEWGLGLTTELKNIAVDQIIKIDINDATNISKSETPPYKWTDVTDEHAISYVHKEDDYDDYSNEPLLPHRNSRIGPSLAVGDLNGDGAHDIYVGNAKGQSGSVFTQSTDGAFAKLSGPWDNLIDHEDTGALIHDLDSDGDNDLYLVHGGYDPDISSSLYEDYLYVNTREGFKSVVLPNVIGSGQSVHTIDYDRDGDLDLIIAGRLDPGRYPYSGTSYLLENNGLRDDSLSFTDVTDEIFPDLRLAGMVTSVLVDDFNSDGLSDVILAGEWLPIQFYKNGGSKFIDVSRQSGLADTQGWWYSLSKADFDQDGDMDYIAGNLGLNYKYKASADAPFEIYAHDFDENGTLDIVLSTDKNGKKLPVRGRECSSQQVPAIERRFQTYDAFANASLEDIYGRTMLQGALHHQVNTFSHIWIRNEGNGRYTSHMLPLGTQMSSITSMQIIDYNGDPYPDVLFGGNLYDSEVETPRSDASYGGIMISQSHGGFQYVSNSESGLYIKGAVKQISSIKLKNETDRCFIVAKNNAPLQVISLKGDGKKIML